MTTLHNRQRWHADHPQPAEPCTDHGVDDDALAAASGIVRAVLWSLVIWFVGAIAASAVLWPTH
jgi:hypothetical protein